MVVPGINRPRPHYGLSSLSDTRATERRLHATVETTMQVTQHNLTTCPNPVHSSHSIFPTKLHTPVSKS